MERRFLIDGTKYSLIGAKWYDFKGNEILDRELKLYLYNQVKWKNAKPVGADEGGRINGVEPDENGDYNISAEDLNVYTKDETDDLLDEKQNKLIEGIGISITKNPDGTETITAIDKYFKGEYTSYEELVAAVPKGSAGDYAHVDGGEGHDVIRYIWDTTDEKWVIQEGSTSEETPESIKSKYESNPNTNAFTDNDKSKLDGIEEGANKTEIAITLSQDIDKALAPKVVDDLNNKLYNTTDGSIPYLQNTLSEISRKPIYNYFPEVTSPKWVIGDIDGTTGLEIESTKTVRLPETPYQVGPLFKIYNGSIWYLKSQTEYNADGSFSEQILYQPDESFIIMICSVLYPIKRLVFAKVDGTDVTEEDILNFDCLLLKDSYDIATEENEHFNPNNLGIYGRKIRPSFVTISSIRYNGGKILDGTTYGNYADVLTLDTWDDVSGGKVNAIVACKERRKLLLLQGTKGNAEWDSVDEVSFINTVIGNYVTLDTTQSIAGRKTFTNSLNTFTGVTNLARAMQSPDKRLNSFYGNPLPSIWESSKLEIAEPNQFRKFDVNHIDITASLTDGDAEDWDASLITGLNTKPLFTSADGTASINASIRRNDLPYIKRVKVEITCDPTSGQVSSGNSRMWLTNLCILGNTTRGTHKMKIDLYNNGTWTSFMSDQTRSKSAEFIDHVCHPQINFGTGAVTTDYTRIRIIFYDFAFLANVQPTSTFQLRKIWWFGPYPNKINKPTLSEDLDGNIVIVNKVKSSAVPTDNNDLINLKYFNDNKGQSVTFTKKILDLSDQLDGTKQSFTITSESSNNATVFYNGLRQTLNKHYTISGTTLTITFPAPPNGQELLIEYII